MDYSYVPHSARVALYDDMLSSPRIIEVPPDETTNFIGALAAEIYNRAQEMGGAIPFSAIKQVAENFIHAEFREIVVSILDKGNTIRFTDQGPGIADKRRAQQPGFTSATEDMKRYIDGVGSGLPIVREYLDIKHGTLTLDDNMNGGSVVTLSLVEARPSSHGADRTHPSSGAAYPADLVVSSLSDRAHTILQLFAQSDILGVQDIAARAEIPLSSTHSELKKLEEAGLIEKIGTKRTLSALGMAALSSL